MNAAGQPSAITAGDVMLDAAGRITKVNTAACSPG
jgi:hypothetical protein